MKRYVADFPHLLEQWHPTKNLELDPYLTKAGSHKKAWWKCGVAHDHEWAAVVSSRVGGRGCPFCGEKRHSSTRNLALLYPHLKSEWHPYRNEGRLPTQYLPNSRERVWWKCPKGPDHEWETEIVSRIRGNGCPFCAGQRTSVTNSLATAKPQLAREWHPTKNGDLTPHDVTLQSSRTVWWKCDAGDDHEWQACIGHRANVARSGKSFCPFCSGYRLSKTNNLAYRHPEIAKYWHLTKNGNRTPENTVSGRFWWQCPHNPDHEWENSIGNIVKNTKGICPFCAGRRLEFEAQYPDLVAEWHPTKNGELKPTDVTAKSGKSVWWKCPKGDDHVFEQKVAGRTAGWGCPFCSAYKVGKDNNLLACFPKVAAELHTTKNKNADPSLIYKHSNTKYIWRCHIR